MLASRTSKWSAGTALACAALLLATWFLLIAPRRGQAADLRDQQASAEQSNDMLRTQIAELSSEYANLPQTETELARLQSQLTPTADLATLVRQISATSTAAGTDLLSIAPGVASLLSTASAAGGAAGTGAGSASAPGSAPDSASAGVVQIPVSILAGGDYYQVVGFLRGLQTQLPRAMLITGLQLDQDSTRGPDGVKVSVIGDVFSLPGASAGTVAGDGVQ